MGLNIAGIGKLGLIAGGCGGTNGRAPAAAGFINPHQGALNDPETSVPGVWNGMNGCMGKPVICDVPMAISILDDAAAAAAVAVAGPDLSA